MEIDRELLTGNINLTLEVYGTPEECDHPVHFKVTLTPERIAQIRQMAAIVKEHKSIDGLNLWSVKAWDYTGDWLNGTWDADDGELALDETEPERMECDAIVVSDDDCHWEAYVNNCDIQCETEYMNISDLEATSAGCACDNTPKPKHCPNHGKVRYTIEGGERDERLRTTD